MLFGDLPGVVEQVHEPQDEGPALFHGPSLANIGVDQGHPFFWMFDAADGQL